MGFDENEINLISIIFIAKQKSTSIQVNSNWLDIDGITIIFPPTSHQGKYWYLVVSKIKVRSTSDRIWTAPGPHIDQKKIFTQNFLDYKFLAKKF